MWEGRQIWILVGVAWQPGNLPLSFTRKNWTPICQDPNYGFPKLPPPSREAELTRKGWVGLQLLNNLNALSHFRTGFWGVGCTRSPDCPGGCGTRSGQRPAGMGINRFHFLGHKTIGIHTSLGRKPMLVLKQVNFNFCLLLRL